MVVLETRHSLLGRPIFRGWVHFREGKFFVLKGFFSEWKRCPQLTSDPLAKVFFLAQQQSQAAPAIQFNGGGSVARDLRVGLVT